MPRNRKKKFRTKFIKYIEIYPYLLIGGRYLRGNITPLIILIFILPELFLIPPDYSITSSDDIQMPISPNNELQNKNAKELLATTPKAFTANLGQFENDDIRFYDQSGGVWFTDDGVWLEVRDDLSINSQQSIVNSPESGLATDDQRLMTNDYKRVILKQEFVGAYPVRPFGRNRVPWNSNFFYGNDSTNWYTDVPNYGEVYYENLYNNIDLRYYTNEKGLKYDLIVHPSGNPDQIRIIYHGADQLEIDGIGNLIIKTGLRDMQDTGLFIYQNNLNIKKSIKGSFKLFSNCEYGFEIIEDYDKFKPIIIDPSIDFSTFFGGNISDMSFAIDVDDNGSSFLTGITHSTDFNTTPGAHDTTHNGDVDGFVIKFNSNGSALEYATFLGGMMWDYPRDINIDANGNAYITGETNSSNFPTTAMAFDTSWNGGWEDAFITKLNHNGSQLLYSTYIGSSGIEDAWSIAVNENGSAHITGVTLSSTFPTTSNAYDKLLTGVSDIYVLKINPSGSSLAFSTFLGGTKDENGWGIAIDHNDNVYVTGNTISDDFPTTAGAFDRTINTAPHSQSYDVFVTKLNRTGSNILYSTYVGGWHNDYGRSITVDSMCNAYVTGYTPSNNFPTTPGAYDTTYNGGGNVGDCFVFKLDYNASTLIYSTFIGGNGGESGLDITLDTLNNAYVIGYTNSSNFPTTADAYDSIQNGTNDAFISILDFTGSILVYSTYLGGSGHDVGFSIDLDPATNFYVTGTTYSFDFPTTPGAYNRTLGNSSKGFLTKFEYNKFINISYLELLYNNEPVETAYSRLGPYSYRVNIVDKNVPRDTKDVTIIIDPGGLDIELTWNSSTGIFSKSNDDNEYITIENTSKIYSFIPFYIMDFDITFNWTFPHENYIDVHVKAEGVYSNPAYLNVSKLFRVENDLVFNGSLTVIGEDERLLENNSIVRGGEQLNWTGSLPIYEDSDNIFPPAGEFNVTVWDNSGNCWLAVSEFNSYNISGNIFNIFTKTANETNSVGELYTINLTGVPEECDKTNRTFTIRIDGDNVTFAHLHPAQDAWQKNSEVYVGVAITDHGGGFVDYNCVMHSTSMDNGITWSNWSNTTAFGLSYNLAVHDFITFEDGDDNLIKWRAADSLGNGLVESEAYSVLVDTQNVTFSNAFPLAYEESAFEDVEVRINISDNTSGVNASRIHYSISNDGGYTWGYWTSVKALGNDNVIQVKLNVTFPNGNGNRIRWRAYDIAGNGPDESEAYNINVNTSLQELLPQVELINPRNGSIISTTSVELSWSLVNQNFPNITNYDVFFDSVLPVAPNMTRVLNTSLWIDNLVDGETYYWTIIPRIGEEVGFCRSGIWQFSVNTSVPVPKVNLIRPENGSILRSPMPTFGWSVEYESSDGITYDVYLDPNKDPSLAFPGLTEPYYSPESVLEDNTTYYWKVVPRAGNIQGPASETWSFTVKKDYVPKFKLKLELEPVTIDLSPGGTGHVNAKVLNLGEITDNISLSIDFPTNVDIVASVNGVNYIEVLKGNIGIFNLTISVSKYIKEPKITLVVIARSETAQDYDKEVEVRETLYVIIHTSEEPSSEKDTSTNYIWFLLILIIIIIVFLVIIIILIKRKKRSDQESQLTEAITIKPIHAPQLVTSKVETLVTSSQSIPQPPVTAGQDFNTALTEPVPDKPELHWIKPTVVAPTPELATHAQQEPQLSPATVQPTPTTLTVIPIPDNTQQTLYPELKTEPPQSTQPSPVIPPKPQKAQKPKE